MKIVKLFKIVELINKSKQANADLVKIKNYKIRHRINTWCIQLLLVEKNGRQLHTVVTN